MEIKINKEIRNYKETIFVQCWRWALPSPCISA